MNGKFGRVKMVAEQVGRPYQPVHTLFLLLLIAELTLGCGLTTHIEVAERALHAWNGTFARIALNHRGALHAGAAFPDMFFFPCGGPAQFSEDTHWTPFLNTSLDYVIEKYGGIPERWSTSTNELIAFILGVASHSVADVLWHSLDIDHGFIRTMANIDFHGEYAPSHSVADALDESLLIFELDLEKRSNSTAIEPWVLPLDDLIEIISRFEPEYNLTRVKILECVSLQYSVRMMEQLTFAGIFKTDVPNDFAATASPFLVSNFYDYPIGGFHSMAAATIDLWQDVTTMLTLGIAACHLNHNPLFIRCRQRRRIPAIASINPARHSAARRRNFVLRRFQILSDAWRNYSSMPISDLVRISDSKDGRVWISCGFHPTYSQRPLPDLQKPIFPFSKRSLRATGIASIKQSIKIVEKADEPYSECGQGLGAADIFGDGSETIIIGCPGANKVKILSKPRTWTKTSTVVELTTPNRMERFGSAVAVLDFNGDGIMDIVVSAPHSEFRGTIYVFYGSGKDFSDQPSLLIVGSTLPGPAWDSDLGLSMLGYSLEVFDVDGDGRDDLIISDPLASVKSPQSGSVYIIFGGTKMVPSPKGKIIDIHHVQDLWESIGTMPYSWFGRSVTVKRISPNRTVLVISAPYSRICRETCHALCPDDVLSVGQVVGFGFYENRTSNTSFSLLGNSARMKLESVDLGYFTSGRLGIAIGEDTFNHNGCSQCGQVQIFDASTILDKGALNIVDLAPLFTLRGKQTSERFGTLVRWIPDRSESDIDLLAVSSPLYGTGTLNANLTSLISVFDFRTAHNLERQPVKRELEVPYHGRLASIKLNRIQTKVWLTLPRATLDALAQGLILELQV